MNQNAGISTAEQRLKRRETLLAWMFLLPALVFVVAFTFLPVVFSAIDSVVVAGSRFRPAQFGVADNYANLLNDPVFVTAFVNNLYYGLVTIPASMGIALVMALWANAHIKGQWFLRLSFFVPTVLPMIAVANIWLFIYTPGYGLLDQITGLFGMRPRNWLGMPDTALPALMVVTVWKEAGFFMIFYLAALQQMPRDLIDVARLEGANRWSIFWRITFPLLMPTTLFVFVNATVNAVRLVDHVIVITKSGPNHATRLLLSHLYEIAFLMWNVNAAAALTIVILAVLGLIAVCQFLMLDRRVHYK